MARESELTYEEIVALGNKTRAMCQWFVLLSEKERREIVAGISGCFTYGVVSMYNRLPAPAQDAIKAAYAVHLVRVAELEALYPAS